MANWNRDGRNQGMFRVVVEPYGHECKVVITCKHIGNYQDAWRVSANIYTGKSRYCFEPIDLRYSFGNMGSPDFDKDGVGDDETWDNYCESAGASDPDKVWRKLFGSYGAIGDFGKLDMLRAAIQCVSEDLCEDDHNGSSPYEDETSAWYSAPGGHKAALASALETLMYALPTHM